MIGYVVVVVLAAVLAVAVAVAAVVLRLSIPPNVESNTQHLTIPLRSCPELILMNTKRVSYVMVSNLAVIINTMNSYIDQIGLKILLSIRNLHWGSA